jgi:hypothetical protein
MTGAHFMRLLAGLDTVQAAYYLRPTPQEAAFAFEPLLLAKEAARAEKARDGTELGIGDERFLVRPYGSKSGYPLVLEHRDFAVECGEFNNPAFFVTYRSRALWTKGAAALDAAFQEWAKSVGLIAFRPEGLSRVDFAFDYLVPVVDFDEDSVLSLSAKDSKWRGDRKLQSMQFGKGEVVLRIYNKIAEIVEQSDKVWLFELWGVRENVWRIEWQARKEILRRFSIRTFEDLFAGQGDVLRYLAGEHDSLRVRSVDSNRSRWALHPLWMDLCGWIDEFSSQGVYREVEAAAVIEWQLQRLALAVYGYHKRAAALLRLRDERAEVTLSEALHEVRARITRLHEPLSWNTDVEAKRRQSRYAA